MTAGLPASFSYNRPASLKPATEPLTLAAIQQRLGTTVLNTSRIELDSMHLAGLQTDQPAIDKPVAFPRTGWKRLDTLLGKTGQPGAYAWYGALGLLADTSRGALVGTLAGGSLGLLGGGAAHLARKNWLLKYCLPVGSLIGGSLGLFSGSTVAFAQSGLRLFDQTKDTLKQHYKAVKVAAQSELV